jgi:predicted Zn-dependent peptidase
MEPFHRIGLFEVDADVKPGVDPDLVAKRLDEVIADYLANGPTADELKRAATQVVADRIRSFERVASQNNALAEGLLYNGNSDFYKTELERYAAVTPDQVKAAMQQWLGRPVLNIRIEPGERPPYQESAGKPTKKSADIKVPVVKRELPPAGPSVPLDFPDVSHVTLSNGIPVAYAHRAAAPLTQIGLQFDAGYAADSPGQRGLENMVMSLLDEGTPTMTSQQIAEEKERLGAILEASGSADRSSVSLSALSANLAPSLALMADIVRTPAFRADDIERVRGQLVTAVEEARTDPNSMAARAYMRTIFGPNHPYGTTALGDEAAIKSIGRDDLVAFEDRWLRPDKAKIFVVSNLPLATVQAELEKAFGNWQAPSVPAGEKTFGAPAERPSSPRIILINRPGSPQSVIFGGEMTPLDPRADLTADFAGSDVLGSGTFSRINQDLRETKGWAYSPYSTTILRAQAVPYLIDASVQADKTGASVAELMKLVKGLLGPEKVKPEELKISVASAVGELPGEFQTSDSVLGAMESNALYGRPDNYYELIADRYRALTTAQVDQALSKMLDPDALVFVVVGDAAKVKPQLDSLGIPVEEAPAP